MNGQVSPETHLFNKFLNSVASCLSYQILSVCATESDCFVSFEAFIIAEAVFLFFIIALS